LDVLSTSWRTIELDDVREFVESASGEGLIWEAKGTAPLPELVHKIRHGVCGLANQLGGIFVVGASKVRGGETYTVTGVPLGGLKADPHDWICQVVTGGLRNPPPFEVKTWGLEDGKVVAAIRVERVAVPPCMTIDGLVYQRVVGETIKITEPLLLAGLISTGTQARERARRHAKRALDQHGGPLSEGGALMKQISLSVAPVALPPDIASRLFTPVMRGLILGSLADLPRFSHGSNSQALAKVDRQSIDAERGAPDTVGDYLWRARVGWDGTVLAENRSRQSTPHELDGDEIIARLWTLANGLAAGLLEFPDFERVPTHMALRLSPDDGFYADGKRLSCPGDPLERWSSLAPPSTEELASVIRELKRGGGALVFEPTSE
jgi:hypothetical protein